MSGEQPDLAMSQETVELITRGINSAIDELGNVGASDTEKLMGSGFENMSLTEMESGGGSLTESFEDFCEQWEWGVRGLIQHADEIARALGLAAGMTYEEDRYWSDNLRIAANALLPTGNPHATEEELSGQSFGDILSLDAPDYSAESFQQAWQDIRQTWDEYNRGPGDLALDPYLNGDSQQ